MIPIPTGGYVFQAHDADKTNILFSGIVKLTPVYSHSVPICFETELIK